MTRFTASLLSCALLGALALSFAPAATPTAPPPRETMKWGETQIIVERQTTATEKDLQLPFHAGAKLVQGYTYRVTTKEGKLLSDYAVAVLTTTDKPAVVAKSYSAKLPGKPKPQSLTDAQGTRTVLAVGSEEEIRTVTITATKQGSKIRLVRALKHGEPPVLPSEMAPVPGPGPGRGGGQFPGRGRGRGRGPGNRQGPSRGGGVSV